MFVEVCVTVCLVCVETCVSFGLEFAECCLEPLFLNSGKALHLGQYQVLGKSVDTQTRQEELLNSTTRITTLDSILVSFLSTIAHCISQWNPSSTKLSLLVYHRASTSGKTQILQNLVQLYSSGLCMEEIFVIVA